MMETKTFQKLLIDEIAAKSDHSVSVFIDDGKMNEHMQRGQREQY